MARKTRLKTHFDGTELDAFIAELEKEALSGSDRATVLVASAAIDEFLRRLLFRRMVDKEAGEALLAETATAPLGSFSARIQAGIALGVVTPTEGKCLNAIRAIRNIYAHRLDHEIDSAGVRDKLNALCDIIDRNHDQGPINRTNSFARIFGSVALALFSIIYKRMVDQDEAQANL